MVPRRHAAQRQRRSSKAKQDGARCLGHKQENAAYALTGRMLSRHHMGRERRWRLPSIIMHARRAMSFFFLGRVLAFPTQTAAPAAGGRFSPDDDRRRARSEIRRRGGPRNSNCLPNNLQKIVRRVATTGGAGSVGFCCCAPSHRYRARLLNLSKSGRSRSVGCWPSHVKRLH